MNAAASRVLITGATGGIGDAIATALVGAGARVLLSGRSEPALAGLASRLGDHVIGTIAIDLNRADSSRVLADKAHSQRVNVVIHAAGVSGFGALSDHAIDELDAVTRTNLIAPMQLTQAMLAQLSAHPKAQLIFIGSTLGRIGIPGFSAYCASKFGLYGFVEALRRELRGTTVQVQWLAPRATRTRFNDARADAFNQRTGSSSDSPQRVAQAVVKLMTREKPQSHLGWFEALAVRLNALLGPLMDTSFTKHRQVLQDLTAKPLNKETLP